MERESPNLISVVLPARNAAATIRAQLDALAGQDYPGRWELVVADCGSTDTTLAAVSAGAHRFRALRLVHVGAAAGNGAAAARNRGAAHATGDLLAFCDADDVVAPDWLSALAAHAHGGDLLAGALDSEMVNRPASRAWQLAATWQRSSINRFLPSLSTANCAVWADAFAALTGFDEDHPGAEDRDLAWRAQLAGYRLLSVPAAVVAYRYRSGLVQTMRQNYRWGVAEARLYRDFGPAGLPRAPLRDVLRAWGWSLAMLPALPWSDARRGRWTIRTSRQAGRLIGSVNDRVFFP